MNYRDGTLDTNRLFDTERRSKAAVVFAVCLIVLVGAIVVASLTQRDFGNVEVTTGRPYFPIYQSTN